MSSNVKTAPPETTQVGDYIVEYEIGRGSFATVYKGFHKSTKEPVAIKSVLRSKLTKKLLENLASEINILKGIRHDHIVALVDCMETETHIHLVMEYCSQGDLSQYIKRKGDGPPSLPSPPGGGLNEVVVRHFLKQLASALEFLRSKNLIHRDLKPQNLLLHPASSVKEGSGYGLPVLKVADFGFARSLPHLSLAETLCGSPLYMAPEILRYEKYDAKADLWSVGTVLYEMCTGKPPFRAQNHVELLKRIEKAQDAISFPGEPTPDDRSGTSPAQKTNQVIVPISDDIKELIRQLLKRNPVERISFEEFFMNPTVSNLPPRSRSRSSNNSSTQDPVRGDQLTLESSKYRNQTVDTIFRNERKLTTIPPVPRDITDPPLESPLRSKPRSLRGGSPSSAPDNRPPLQLPISSPKTAHVYVGQKPLSSNELSSQPSSAPINTSARRMRTMDVNAETAHRTLTPQPSSQPNRRSMPVGITDVSRRYSVPEDDALLDKDYVVVEKRAVELNVLADEVAASPATTSGRSKTSPGQGQSNTLSPPIPTSLTQYRTPPPPFIPYPYTATAQTTNNTLFFSTTPPFALPATPVPEEPKSTVPLHRPALGQVQPTSSPVTVRSGSPRDGGATSALAKAISMASMRLFGASSSPPSWRNNTSLIGFNDGSASRTGGSMDANPEENGVLQTIEDTAHKAYVVSQFGDSKMDGIRPLNGLHYSPTEDQEPTKDSILAEEAFFLYLRALALLQSGMDVARKYWEERRLESKPASQRLNNGVQWIRDRFNECLEKAESARQRSGIDHRDESGVVIEKLIYERALELSKAAALKELVSDDYGESEKSYQTSIWMLHAILDGAGEDGRSEAIEDDDREILNKFIRSIENRLSLLRRRIAGART
ncbi:serine/threonine-protein kinase ULK2 [Entomortierella parvispora]|uniref:Serine/threonine-protein kinase ATG1 n=1 Tax=Entomortierella parvispora TaxID=205924 RepID=A0A9P3H191_9FUNG|nr:serine/threonine-protein kinase ULK2 [Entomortierella parvispora]